MTWESKFIGVGALLVGLAAANASAATVDLTFVSVNPSQPESISTTGGGAGSFLNQTTGQFNFTVSNNVGAGAVLPTTNGSPITTWCIELDQSVAQPQFSPTYSVLGPGLGAYVSPFGNSANVNAFFNQYYSNSLTATQKVAFQLDIWELVLDSSPGSLTTGSFRVAGSDSAITQAASWLSTFNTSTTGIWTVYQLHHATAQDEIFAVQGGGAGNGAPLPAALPGGLALIAGLALMRKVSRKSRA